jgi:drug/metabolite transporter (DMT)-like permease
MVNIALLYASSPVLIALGSVLWMGEAFTWRQALGALLAMAGVVHVVVQGEWLRLSQVEFVAGDLWVVGASVAWAAYALLQRRWPSALSSSAHLAATCAGGVVILVPFAIWELLQPATPSIGPHAVGMMVLAALVPGLGAYWMYGWTQKVLGAGRVAMTLYLGPLYSALVSWLALGEQLGWHHAAGAVLILSGVGLVVATARRV